MKCEKWLKLALTITLMAIAFSLFFMMVMLLTGNGYGVSGNEAVFFISLLPEYLMLGCGLFTLIMGITGYNCYLPVLVSFGCKRRDAMVGLQILERVPAMLCVLVGAAISFAIRNDVTRSFLEIWPMLFCILWIAGSVSGIAGSLSVRFGRIATVITTLVFVLCGMAGGFVGGVSSGGGLPAAGMGGDIVAFLTPVLAAAAVVLWAAELIVSYRILRKYEVKL